MLNLMFDLGITDGQDWSTDDPHKKKNQLKLLCFLFFFQFIRTELFVKVMIYLQCGTRRWGSIAFCVWVTIV